MRNMVLGAQLYTVRDRLQTLSDVAETLHKVAKIGYTAFQVAGLGPVDPRELAKVFEDSGMACACTHSPWVRFLHDLDALIEEHKMWRCRHLAIGVLPEIYDTPDGSRRFADQLGPILERLSKEGMDLSCHNQHQDFTRYNGRTMLEFLLDLTRESGLRLELDTYWVQMGGGDPAVWIRKCAGRVPIVHLKDMVVSPAHEIHFAEVGEGNLNWPAILGAAAGSGVEYCMVEQDKCYGRDPFESLAISYRNLKEMGLN
jgi:sugar phosphate isomerase/epimerase